MAREADASRAAPLTIVSSATAGEELERVGQVAADGFGGPVVVVGTDTSLVSPPGALAPREVEAAVDAALATLMSAAPRRALLDELRAAPPADVAALGAALRKLGLDLSHGAVALCAAVAPETALPPAALMARMPDGRVLGLLDASADVPELGTRIALSAPRRDAALLHEALAEAELLLELPDNGEEDTYRLLIGVLLRDSEELDRLARGTIGPIAAYDEQHGSELLATLECFLAHHSSTTEAAEAMNLHRHTIGYRLARVHEVSGLSPYESAGRERLGLGLKARQILDAHRRRPARL